MAVERDRLDVDILFVGAGPGNLASVIRLADLCQERGIELPAVLVIEKAPEIEWNLVVRKGVRIFGSWAWSPEELVQASRLITSGEIDRKPLISHTFSLEDAREAYETQLREEEAIKVLLTP